MAQLFASPLPTSTSPQPHTPPPTPPSHPTPAQLDFLEHPAVTDVVVCSVVLEEVQHKNSSAYQRLRAMCASDEKRFFVFANEHHRCFWMGLQLGPALGLCLFHTHGVPCNCLSVAVPVYDRDCSSPYTAWCAALHRQAHIATHLDARRSTFVKTEPGESPNDRNDRAIRVAAKW